MTEVCPSEGLLMCTYKLFLKFFFFLITGADRVMNLSFKIACPHIELGHWEVCLANASFNLSRKVGNSPLDLDLLWKSWNSLRAWYWSFSIPPGHKQ